MPNSNGKPVADPAEWLCQYGDSFYAYAYSRLHDANAAEEVVQETFLAGIRHLKSYRGESSQKSWLITILRRKIVDHVRVRDRFENRRASDDEMDSCPIVSSSDGDWRIDPADCSSIPEAVASFNELWDRLHHCLDELSESQRSAFVLRELEHLEADEICKLLEIKPSNLWVRLHRARLKLAACVGELWFEEVEEAEDHVE